MDPMVIMAAVTALVSGGAAWGAVRVTLNGTKHDIRELKTTFEEHLHDDREMRDRLARLETKIDLLKGDPKGWSR